MQTTEMHDGGRIYKSGMQKPRDIQSIHLALKG